MENTGLLQLSVDYVQDLANMDLDALPSRYVRPERATEVVSVDDSLLVPVIDLSKLTDATLSSLHELQNFHLACQDWGFFQLINHGLPKDVIEKVKTDVTEFFKLPSDVKKEFAQEPGKWEGYGQQYVFSDEQKLDWGDMLFLVTLPENEKNMNIWPTSPPTFRETISKYSLELEKIKMYVLALMAKNLEIEPKKFTSMFKKGTQSMRFNYYPPCLEDDKVLGISPHSDATGITFLIQAGNVQGLQIKHEGRWVPVVLSADAILVNIGDVLEVLCNGKYRRIEHRVVVNKNKERLSVAAFHELNENEIIGPFPELIKEGQEKCYKSISWDEYKKLYSSEKLDGKSMIIEKMKLLK